jgi:hypothetical protein
MNAMIDTNQVQQFAATAAAVKQQIVNWWPTLVPLGFIIGREVKALNGWLLGVAHWVMAHGGLGRLLVKLFWQPAPPTPTATTANVSQP